MHKQNHHLVPLQEITRDGTRCHMVPQLSCYCLRKQWPENCPKWNSEQCAPQPPWRLTQTRSVHWWESPWVVAKWMAKHWPFDSTELYPQLWINDSKRPYPRGLMRSARLQAGAESRKSGKNVTLTTQSYNDTVLLDEVLKFRVLWDKYGQGITHCPNRAVRNVVALYPSIKIRVHRDGDWTFNISSYVQSTWEDLVVACFF